MFMPSRMDRYYRSDYDIKKRTTRNHDLYKSIYEDAEYTNVEGISIIEKNEKIDIEKIRELIGVTEKKTVPIEKRTEKVTPTITFEEENKNYDIRDILDKAKNERPEIERTNTQYDILKSIKLNDNYNVPQSLSDEELKTMIEAITSNSKLNQTGDLLDELKTIHNPIKDLIDEQIQNDKKENEIDKTFFTSSLGFTSDDFEDLKEIKDDIKKNSLLTKILIFILLVVLVTGIMFLIYHFMK